MKLVADQANILRLEGELDFASAVAVRPELEKRLDAASSVMTLDLSGLTRVNSVGLSLILVAARRLEQQGGSLVIRGVPEGLQSMAAVYGLDQWLNSIAAPSAAG